MKIKFDLLFKRISKLSLELQQVKIELILTKRKCNQVIEENDRLLSELLKLKVVK